MNIALINASPKARGSSSGILLDDLKRCLGQYNQIEELSFRTAMVSKEMVEKLKQADTWIFAFPLYVDALPAHFLSCLMQLEKLVWENGKRRIYGIANCGFYEGKQAEPALNVLKNWCKKIGFVYGGSLGIGGGGAIAVTEKYAPDKGPRIQIFRVMKKFAGSILQNENSENKYATVAFPRFVYKICAQNCWRQMIKSNGGKVADLKRRP